MAFLTMSRGEMRSRQSPVAALLPLLCQLLPLLLVAAAAAGAVPTAATDVPGNRLINGGAHDEAKTAQVISPKALRVLSQAAGVEAAAEAGMVTVANSAGGLKLATIKENGRVTAKCATAGHVITSIVGPIYGAPPRCNSTRSYKVVAGKCLYKPVCTLVASDAQFGGDPCPRAPDRLTFRYSCGPKPRNVPTKKPPPKANPPPKSVLKAVTASQGRAATARCEPGEAIRSIVDPLYGAPDHNCNSTKSYRVVVQKCLGRTRCMVFARNADFQGDPCKDAVKKISFEYSCASGPNRPTQPGQKPKPKPPAKQVMPQDGDNLQTSLLWGQAGELWKPTGRIADWSYAGYMANEAPIPDYPVKFNVKDYGAKGDGQTDDTGAILAAVKAACDAAFLLTAVDCGSERNPRKCPAPHKGFGNEGQRGVAVLLPAGTYRITRAIEITQSNVVVRGDGVDRTTLFYPRGLQAIYGSKMQWAFMGGFLVVKGKNFNSGYTGFLLTRLTDGASKGGRRLQVASTAGFQEGKWVRLYATAPTQRGSSRRKVLQEEQQEMADGSSSVTLQQHPLGSRSRRLQANGTSPTAAARAAAAAAAVAAAGIQGGFLPLTPGMMEGKRQAEALGLNDGEHGGEDMVTAAMASGTLDAYLYGENAVDSGTAPFAGVERIRFVSRVSAVGNGWVELERPLPYDVRMAWRPALYTFDAAVQHSGFEDFTVHFNWEKYPSHMKVAGYNGFWLYGCANSWVRNIRVINADTGAETINSDFITMRNLSFEVEKPRGNKMTQDADGHHGMWAAASSNVLFTQFNFKSRFIHDLTLDVFAQECAYTNGKGIDMTLDMHRSGVHNNLLSNIDVGLAQRTFSSSGQESKGSHAAANNTWWNIHSSRGAMIRPPFCKFGPLLGFVGDYGPVDEGNFGRPSPLPSPPEPYRLFPGYCSDGVRWWVEVVKPGDKLYPADLYPAMVATRQERLGS